jgi:choice-of-anchor A domain-containing protein
MNYLLTRSWVIAIGLTFPFTIMNSSLVQAFDLGGASDFNLYLSGDLQQSFSDIEGRSAIGGNAILNHYLVGNLRPGTDVLLVGGNLSFGSGTIDGNAKVGGSYNGNATVRLSNSITTGVAGLNQFFQTTNQYLSDYSNLLGGLSNNGVTALQYGTNLVFTGNGGGNRQVFQVNATNLAQATSIAFMNTGNADILVNVTGTIVNLSNPGFSGLSGTNSRVFFNFPTATEILMAGSFGSYVNLLAPQATVRSNWGQMRGQLIARDLLNYRTVDNQEISLGNLQVNDPGNLGPPPSIPTPALLPGLLGMGYQFWRKRS